MPPPEGGGFCPQPLGGWVARFEGPKLGNRRGFSACLSLLTVSSFLGTADQRRSYGSPSVPPSRWRKPSLAPRFDNTRRPRAGLRGAFNTSRYLHFLAQGCVAWGFGAIRRTDSVRMQLLEKLANLRRRVSAGNARRFAKPGTHFRIPDVPLSVRRCPVHGHGLRAPPSVASANDGQRQ
jgi:hypothetical protein